MVCDGSLALGLSLRIAASFHDRISPRKIPSQGGAVEGQLAGLDPIDIDHHHDAGHHRRELDQAIGLQLAGAERHVGRAEGDLLALDLPDAIGRADRAIVHGDAGLFLVGLDPLGINRIGEARAGARNLGGGDRRRRGRGDQARRRQGAEELQCPLLLPSRRLPERRTRSTDSVAGRPPARSVSTRSSACFRSCSHKASLLVPQALVGRAQSAFAARASPRPACRLHS